MKFVSKYLAIKLKEKGFDKPCFGYYYNDTPTGFTDGELVLSRYYGRGGTFMDTLKRHDLPYTTSNIIDTPTTDQVLEWLREEKDIYITVIPEKVFDYTCYGLSIIQFNSPKHNFDTFRMNSSFDNINYYDVCVMGIKYVVENLI